MELQIKEEPLEYQDESTFDERPAQSDSQMSLLDSQYNSELKYLNSFNDLFTSFSDDKLLIESMELTFDSLEHVKSNKKNDFSIMDALNQIQSDNKLSQVQAKPTLNKIDEQLKVKNLKQKQQQLALEKKKILISLLETEKKSENSNQHFEHINSCDENKILLKLNSILEDSNHNLSPTKLNCLKRFRSKLELRKLKREQHLQLFDIDSYVNELIDSEKLSFKSAKNQDDDIIFECETLKSTVDKNEPEIVATTCVLDRFRSINRKFESSRFSIGMVQSRNDDVKCLLSPLTNKVLKPYVRRDNLTRPVKLELNFQITKQDWKERHPIDYVHLRPEHVMQIDVMCEKFFWSGIDVSDCLNYPDYTLVALYRKLIIGFAFMVPNPTHKESYLSFIFVHPDWRINSKDEQNVSVAQYMLYYLIQKNPDFDVTLHVACNSPAVLFYQKFGFEIEEYIKNFYDKYYSSTQKLSKDAFLMRLSRH